MTGWPRWLQCCSGAVVGGGIFKLCAGEGIVEIPAAQFEAELLPYRCTGQDVAEARAAIDGFDQEEIGQDLSQVDGVDIVARRPEVRSSPALPAGQHMREPGVVNTLWRVLHAPSLDRVPAGGNRNYS